MYNFFEAPNNDESQDLNKASFSTDFVNAIISRYVLDSDIVMDNFSGTGTTMVACESHNIKGIYIELSDSQCEYTKARVEKGVQIRLFS